MPPSLFLYDVTRCLRQLAERLPGYARSLAGIDPQSICAPEALEALPLLRKSELPALQATHPPFGGLSNLPPSAFGRLFQSPGPIFEAGKDERDPWGTGRAFHAAGVAFGDIVLNTLSYHLTPGGFFFDAGARRVGAAVIPAGPGNTEQQVQLVAGYRPTVFAGTPDFLSIILDRAGAQDIDVSSIRRAVVTGSPLTPQLRDKFDGFGIEVFQSYATADVGLIAYESVSREGLITSEDVHVEIIDPGTGRPAPEGGRGEVVVTRLDPHRPLVRLALGDLSAWTPGVSPCGRTGRRIEGSLGRCDLATKVKGLFLRPEQLVAVKQRHGFIREITAIVQDTGGRDAITLNVYADDLPPASSDIVRETFRAITRLDCQVKVLRSTEYDNNSSLIEDIRWRCRASGSMFENIASRSTRAVQQRELSCN